MYSSPCSRTELHHSEGHRMEQCAILLWWSALRKQQAPLCVATGNKPISKTAKLRGENRWDRYMEHLRSNFSSLQSYHCASLYVQDINMEDDYSMSLILFHCCATKGIFCAASPPHSMSCVHYLLICCWSRSLVAWCLAGRPAVLRSWVLVFLDGRCLRLVTDWMNRMWLHTISNAISRSRCI